MVTDGLAEDASVAQAIDRARRGDAEAFGELYRRFSRRVLGLCLRLLGSREDAEDAASEVFMKVRAAIDRYDPSRPFQPWLVGIASRHCLDRLRRRRRERLLFENEPAEPSVAGSPLPAPLAGVLAEEDRATVDAALGALPDRYRLPLVLRYQAEMSYDEIAEKLGWTRERVGVSLFRAKQSLRRALGGVSSR
jgi:RNA polymerase sigma-70 factor (ECF subfamily)